MEMRNSAKENKRLSFIFIRLLSRGVYVGLYSFFWAIDNFVILTFFKNYGKHVFHIGEDYSKRSTLVLCPFSASLKLFVFV